MTVSLQGVKGAKGDDGGPVSSVISRQEVWMQ